VQNAFLCILCDRQTDGQTTLFVYNVNWLNCAVFYIVRNILLHKESSLPVMPSEKPVLVIIHSNHATLLAQAVVPTTDRALAPSATVTYPD